MTKLNLILQAKKREVVGKKVSQLRKQNLIPASLYGHKIKPMNLTVDYLAFEKLFNQAGESTLVDLIIDDGKPVKILISDVQLDSVTNQIIHADFHQVRMDEKLRAEIQLKFIGEAPAVKELSGVLVTSIHEVEVECLPQDLVHEIEVDLSSLKTFDDVIKISDIKIAAGLKILHTADDVVVLVQEPRSEKELADLEAKPEEKLPEQVVEPPAEPKEE